jgi:group I intron endonuclease
MINYLRLTKSRVYISNYLRLNTHSYTKSHNTLCKRYYSTNSGKLLSVNPTLVLVVDSLYDENCIKSFREILKDKSGIYSFINTINGNQYIGSAKDLYIRLNEHLNNRKSNANLQKAFNKHGLDKFRWIVYEYFTYESKILSNDSLLKLETSYIKAFDFSTLYNMKKEASSLLGYKHTDSAIQKMIDRFKDKTNHPMFGKKHSENVLKLISKSGVLNPMYNKKHKDSSKELMRIKRNKYVNGVGIYNLEDNLVHKFNNNVELAEYLNISKTTVGKYLNNKLLYKGMYIFKPLD